MGGRITYISQKTHTQITCVWVFFHNHLEQAFEIDGREDSIKLWTYSKDEFVTQHKRKFAKRLLQINRIELIDLLHSYPP